MSIISGWDSNDLGDHFFILHFNKPELGNFTKFIYFDIPCINIQLLINQPYPSSFSASCILSDHILTIYEIFPNLSILLLPAICLSMAIFPWGESSPLLLLGKCKRWQSKLGLIWNPHMTPFFGGWGWGLHILNFCFLKTGLIFPPHHRSLSSLFCSLYSRTFLSSFKIHHALLLQTFERGVSLLRTPHPIAGPTPSSLFH